LSEASTFGLYHRYYQGVRCQIFPGNRLHLLQRYRFVEGVFGVRVGVAETVEFIEGVGHGESAKVLARNLPLANDLGLGAFEFFSGETFAAQQFGLAQQFRFHQAGLFWRRAGVKGEVSWRETKDVLRTDVISQAELLADAHEQARAEVAAC